jgi:hypothetical protein
MAPRWTAVLLHAVLRQLVNQTQRRAVIAAADAPDLRALARRSTRCIAAADAADVCAQSSSVRARLPPPASDW